MQLIGNTMRDNRGRGLICKSGNGTISGNQFINNKFTSIEVQPDLFFQEGSYVTNLTISTNLFETSPGAILVGDIRSNNIPSVFQNQQFISIVSNLFIDVPYAPIVLTSTRSFTVLRNIFIDSSCEPVAANLRYDAWYSPGQPVYLYSVSNGVVSANSITGGKNCTQLNQTHSGVAVMGQSSSVTCC